MIVAVPLLHVGTEPDPLPAAAMPEHEVSLRELLPASVRALPQHEAAPVVLRALPRQAKLVQIGERP